MNAETATAFVSNLEAPEVYAAKAADCRKRSAESWERSDSDGFLSQWANDKVALDYDYAASVAANGGKLEDLALFFNGQLASHKQLNGQWGIYWVLNDEAAEAYGKRFFSGSNAKNSVQRDRAKGFTYGTVSIVALFSQRTGDVFPHPEALAAGQFEILSTDGAYDHIEQGEADRIAEARA
jgi:hypothetical protein